MATKVASLSVENLKPRQLAAILEAIQKAHVSTYSDTDEPMHLRLLADKTLGVYKGY